MKIFYLFRHGDTYETKHHLLYGENIYTSPILPESRVYLEKMGEYLNKEKVEYFVSSEIIRCRQTAEIISSKIGVQFVTDSRINEFDPDIPQKGGVEEKFIKGVQSFVKDLQSSFYNRIAICCHGSSIAIIMNTLCFNRFSPDEFLDYPPPGVLWTIGGTKLLEKDFRK